MADEKPEIELAKIEYDRKEGSWNASFRVKPRNGIASFTMEASLPGGASGTQADGYPPNMPIEEAAHQMRTSLHLALQGLLAIATDDLRRADRLRQKDVAAPA